MISGREQALKTPRSRIGSAWHPYEEPIQRSELEIRLCPRAVRRLCSGSGRGRGNSALTVDCRAGLGAALRACPTAHGNTIAKLTLKAARTHAPGGWWIWAETQNRWVLLLHPPLFCVPFRTDDDRAGGLRSTPVSRSWFGIEIVAQTPRAGKSLMPGSLSDALPFKRRPRPSIRCSGTSS